MKRVIEANLIYAGLAHGSFLRRILDIRSSFFGQKNKLSAQKDFWFELSDSQKQEIKTGINQLDSGQRISLEDFFVKTSMKTDSSYQTPPNQCKI
ncbi:MAG: hypothetical protein WCP85_15575 [Mariniphaga sp.]